MDKLKILFWSLLFMLVGCSGNDLSNSEKMITPLIQPSSTRTPMEPIETIDIKSAVLTPTITSSIPPTPTFQPVDLTLQEAKEIQDFLSSISDDCMLSCWQGVTPGISTGDDALRLFPRLGIQIKGEWPYTSLAPEFGTYGIFYPEDESLALTWVSINWNENYVTEIFLDYLSIDNLYEDAPFLLPANIIEHLDSPQDIKIYLSQGGIYTLYFNFKDFNTALFYSGRGTSKSDGSTEICLTDYELEVAVRIYYLEGEEGYLLNGPKTDPFYDQSEYTGLETDEFLKQLIDPNQCVLASPYN